MSQRELVVGVDFGTNTLSLSVFRRGNVEMIESSSGGNRTTSTALSIQHGTEDDYQIMIGDHAGSKATATISSPHPFIGRSIQQCASLTSPTVKVIDDPDYQGNVAFEFITHKEYPNSTTIMSPEEILALSLHSLRQRTQFRIGEEIDKIALTCPAHFTQEQRVSLLAASILAGWTPVMDVVDEPIALGVYHLYKDILEKQKQSKFGIEKVLVYDLGIALDVSILQIDIQKDDVKIGILTTNRDTTFGSQDFENVIYERIIQECITRSNVDPRTNLTCWESKQKRLLRQSIEIKHTLSRNNMAIVDLADFVTLDEDVDSCFLFTPKMFQELTSPLSAKVHTSVQAILSSIGLSTIDINTCIIAGGSTQLPCIKDEMMKMFDQDKIFSQQSNWDVAVSGGAALLGAQYNTTRQNTHIKFIIQQQKTRVQVVHQNQFFDVLSTKNQLPITKEINFTTAKPLENLVAKFYMGSDDGDVETLDVSNLTFLHTFGSSFHDPIENNYTLKVHITTDYNMTTSWYCDGRELDRVNLGKIPLLNQEEENLCANALILANKFRANGRWDRILGRLYNDQN